MTIADREMLMEIAAELLAGANRPDAPSDAAGLRLAPPAAGGEPVRRDRRATGQASFHLLATSAAGARLARAEAAAVAAAAARGWRPVTLGAPSEGAEAAAERDLEIALEERPAALIGLGAFIGASPTGADEEAYAAALGAASAAAGARLVAIAARRLGSSELKAGLVTPRGAGGWTPAMLEDPESPARAAAAAEGEAPPLAFRLLLIG